MLSTINSRRTALCYRVVRPSVRCLSVRQHVFQWNSASICITCKWELLKRFSGSEVKGQGHSEAKCNFRQKNSHQLTAVRPLYVRGGGMAWRSRLTCLIALLLFMMFIRDNFCLLLHDLEVLGYVYLLLFLVEISFLWCLATSFAVKIHINLRIRLRDRHGYTSISNRLLICVFIHYQTQSV